MGDDSDDSMQWHDGPRRVPREPQPELLSRETQADIADLLRNHPPVVKPQPVAQESDDAAFENYTGLWVTRDASEKAARELLAAIKHAFCAGRASRDAELAQLRAQLAEREQSATRAQAELERVQAELAQARERERGLRERGEPRYGEPLNFNHIWNPSLRSCALTQRAVDCVNALAGLSDEKVREIAALAGGKEGA